MLAISRTIHARVMLQIMSPITALLIPAAVSAQTVDSLSLIERGEYVARAGGCMSCHSEDLSGGYEVETPMGTIVSTNISPSNDYGTGAYSRDDLEKVLRYGVSPDHRLYPAMPYASYQGMTDDDIDALYAWMMDQDPVEQATETETDLPFPFNIRSGVIAWNWLFMGDRDLPEPQNPVLQRGAYLVDHLGHCGECHTPRNDFFGMQDDQYLQGEMIDGWHAPNLTADAATGLGAWDTQDIVDYLAQGNADDVVQAAGPMGEFVAHNSSHLNEDDLLAMASYLQSLSAVNTGSQATPAVVPARDRNTPQHDYNQIRNEMSAALARDDLGAPEQLYIENCAACHGVTGQGQPQAGYPPLVQNAALRRDDPNNLIQVLLHGVEAGKVYRKPGMPAFEDELSHAQIATLANYTRTTFGERPDSTLTADDVAEIADYQPEMPWPLRALQIAAWVGVAVLAVGLALLARWFVRRRQSKQKEV